MRFRLALAVLSSVVTQLMSIDLTFALLVFSICTMFRTMLCSSRPQSKIKVGRIVVGCFLMCAFIQQSITTFGRDKHSKGVLISFSSFSSIRIRWLTICKLQILDFPTFLAVLFACFPSFLFIELVYCSVETRLYSCTKHSSIS